jgi:hypothetical protein
VAYIIAWFCGVSETVFIKPKLPNFTVLNKFDFLLLTNLCMWYLLFGYWFHNPNKRLKYGENFYFSSIIFGCIHGITESLFMLCTWAIMEKCLL